jgi:hypothetical protein
MASLCLCGIGNCAGDDGINICPNFLRKQHEEYLRLAQDAFQTQQAYAIAQAQAHLAQVQAQAHSQALMAHAQQQYTAFKVREEQEKAARIMIKMSGVNVVPCHLCNKECDGLQGLKTHMRCHYNTFACNVCGFAIANNAVATRHNITCQALDFMKAYSYFHSEDERLMREHKAASPSHWTHLPHASF